MKYKKRNVRWMLVVYDLLVYELSAVLLLGLYGGNDKLSISGMLQQMVLALLCVFSIRLIGNVYGQIWRYGGIQCYIRLLYTDAIAFFVYLILELVLPVEKITFARMLCLISINLLGALALRMMYRYAYKCSNQETKQGRFLASLLYTFGNSMIFIERDSALSAEEINTRLNMLREVCETGDDSQAREVLRKAVPTFKKPEEVNRAAEFAVHQKKSEPEREEAVAI